MSFKPARNQFTPEEITAILRRNVELFKDEPNFATYFTELTMHLLDAHYGEGRLSSELPPNPPPVPIPGYGKLDFSPGSGMDLRVFLTPFPEESDELDDFEPPTDRGVRPPLPADPNADPPTVRNMPPIPGTPIAPGRTAGPSAMPLMRSPLPISASGQHLPSPARPTPLPVPPPAPGPRFPAPAPRVGSGPGAPPLPAPSFPPPASGGPSIPPPPPRPSGMPNMPPPNFPSPRAAAPMPLPPPTGNPRMPPPQGPLSSSANPRLPRIPSVPVPTPPPVYPPSRSNPGAGADAASNPPSNRPIPPIPNPPPTPGLPPRPVSVNSRTSGVFQLPNAPLLTPLGDALREPHKGREESERPPEHQGPDTLGKKTQVYRVVRSYKSSTSMQSPCPMCGTLVPMDQALCPGCGHQVH